MAVKHLIVLHNLVVILGSCAAIICAVTSFVKCVFYIGAFASPFMWHIYIDSFSGFSQSYPASLFMYSGSLVLKYCSKNIPLSYSNIILATSVLFLSIYTSKNLSATSSASLWCLIIFSFGGNRFLVVIDYITLYNVFLIFLGYTDSIYGVRY